MMFDRTFFDSGLNEQLDAKRKYSPDGDVSLKLRLTDGTTETVWAVETVADTYAVFAVYPHRGRPRATSKEERKLGAPPADFDYLAVPYFSIKAVEITTKSPASQSGFRPQRG